MQMGDGSTTKNGRYSSFLAMAALSETFDLRGLARRNW
jgi:hypothetical protein